MVNLVEDWKVVENYAKDLRAQGYYQILGYDDALEIRVAIGRLGFKKEFQNKEDPLLNSIIAFCESRKYVKVSRTISDEFFFR